MDLRSTIVAFLLLWGFQKAKAQDNVQWASRVLNYSSELSTRQYAAKQVLGVPDVFPDTGDHPCAWVPFGWNTIEFIHVAFENPVWARQVVIVETLNPSAITNVLVHTEGGRKIRLYAEKAVKHVPGRRLFSVAVPPLEEPVVSVEVYFNGRNLKKPYGVDAIGLATDYLPVTPGVNIVPFLNLDMKLTFLEPVNGPGQEIGPIFSHDGSRLYFGRKLHEANTGGMSDPEDIWYLDLSQDTAKAPERVSSQLNNSESNFVLATGVNEVEWLILGNVYQGKSRMRSGMSMAFEGIQNDWQQPLSMRVDRFTNQNERFFGNGSADGKKMILSIETGESEGGLDLFLVSRVDSLTWSKPVHLGGAINSAGDEIFPVISPDGNELFFTSNGFSGFGGYDVYRSKRLDDTWTNWSMPENLGSIINSSKNEGGISFSLHHNQGVLSREVSEDNYDLFTFQLPLIRSYEEWIRVSGDIPVAYTTEPEKTRIQFTTPTAKKDEYYLSAGKDGRFDVFLPKRDHYNYTVTIPGFTKIEGELDLTDINSSQVIRRDMNSMPDSATFKALARTNSTFLKLNADEPAVVHNGNGYDFESVGAEPVIIDLTRDMERTILQSGITGPEVDREQVFEPYVMNSQLVYFDHDSYELDKEAGSLITALAMQFKKTQGCLLVIKGHTSEQETQHVDGDLSRKRAEIVAEHLLLHGVDESAISLEWAGDTLPLSYHDSKVAGKLNRRVEVRVIR